MIPSRAHIQGKKNPSDWVFRKKKKKNPSPWVFQELCSWLVAYISKHRAGDAHAHTYCKGWPTPVALNLADWVCAKPTGDPCMCQWFSL